MFDTCTLTVFLLMKRSSAIWRSVWPCARRDRTSISRAVRPRSSRSSAGSFRDRRARFPRGRHAPGGRAVRRGVVAASRPSARAECHAASALRAALSARRGREVWLRLPATGSRRSSTARTVGPMPRPRPAKIRFRFAQAGGLGCAQLAERRGPVWRLQCRAPVRECDCRPVRRARPRARRNLSVSVAPARTRFASCSSANAWMPICTHSG